MLSRRRHISVFVATIILTDWSHAIAVEKRPVTKSIEKKIGRKNQPKLQSYVHNINIFKSSLNIPITSKTLTITIPDDDFLKRLETPYKAQKSKKERNIEPIQITTSKEEDKILAIAGKIAKPQQRLALAHYIKQNIATSESIPGTQLKLVNLNPSVANLLDMSAFDSLHAKDHYQLTVATKSLSEDVQTKRAFIRQVSKYLSPKQMKGVKSALSSGRPLDVDTQLLPEFARRTVRQHTLFKGPNCFHAALSFQTPALSQTSRVNIREEAGYHRNMINYDELWRAIQLEFHEIDVSATDMQYGDLIAFFDTPTAPHKIVDFRTLRHATTYLFGGYVFAKGSKSANSPYIIRPLAEEWDTWNKFTTKLGAKVFRKNINNGKKAALWDPSDWMQ
jgi:hypothetical protein